MPVHTLYGGAQLFKAGTCPKLGALARKSMQDFAPDENEFASVLGIHRDHAATVYSRVRDKLEHQPIEDYRIDFEDGYGYRPDAEEDATADAAGVETAAALFAGTLPPYFGIRIKAGMRGHATLRRYMSALLEASGGRLPANFCVTLPKVTAASQVHSLLDALRPYSDPAIEIMIETPSALFVLPALVEAAGPRLRGAHFGPYDYTASLGLTASNQDVSHPACDFARNMMLAALADTGIALADGPTMLMPIPPRDAVHKAWKLHYRNIRHSLSSGFFQGWDLHPAQLPVRYAAVYAFFLEGLSAASERLRNFIEKSEQATRVGQVFDDAATGRGLVNYFLRAVQCGAIDESELPPTLRQREVSLRSQS